ncbi:MAG: P-II family nitrogen regulator [Burkholderiales bacterium]|nr:P-II family nitrogen regulator [Burkholderiales bacterium]
MKEINAVVQPGRLARVRDALRGLPDFPGMTVERVEGCSPARAGDPGAGIKGELTDYSPGVRITLLAPDALVPEIVRRIHAAAHTGQKGDGILWVRPVEAVITLREPPAAG